MLVAIAALATGGAIAVVGGPAAAEIIRLGNIELEIDGGVKPKRLPAKGRAPIKLTIRMDVRTLDRSTPPGLDVIVLDFDRHGTIDTRGLPRCRRSQIENTFTDQARRACRRALVGTGRVAATVDFPDQAPIPAFGPLLAFNGVPKGKHPVILFHMFPSEPIATAIVSEGVISKAPGKTYGKRVRTEIPIIAGGNGSLTGFDVTIKRRWEHGGKRRSYVSARCRNGHFVATGDLIFREGSRVNGSIVRECGRRR